MDLSDIAQEVVQNCKACALTNAGHHIGTPGKSLWGDRPGAYWEVDFTEVKPAKYGNKHISFHRYFLRLGRIFPHRKGAGQCNGKEDTGRDFPEIWHS